MESNSPPQVRGRTSLERKLMFVLAVVFLAAAGLAIFTGVKVGQFSTYRKEHGPAKGGVAKDGAYCTSAACVNTAFGVMAAMNTSVDPCDDFYLYACGQFITDHPIPDTDSSVSRFGILDDQVFKNIKSVIMQPLNSADNEAETKAKTAFLSCMDQDQINKVGFTPLMAPLNEVGGWPMLGGAWSESSWKLETALAKLVSMNYGALFNFYVYVDDYNSTLNRIQISEANLNLPRDYYLDDDYSKYLAGYKQFMLEISNVISNNAPNVKQDVDDMIDFEIALAKITSPGSERTDPEANYHLMKMSEVKETIKGIDFMHFLNTVFSEVDIVINEREEVVNLAKEFLPKLAKLIAKTPKRVLANYVGWSLVDYGVYLMSDDLFSDIRHRYQKISRGTVGSAPRWSTCTYYGTRDFKMVLGKMFVDKFFSKKAKKTASEMIDTLKESFKRILDDNKWMSAASVVKAKAKADGITTKIGYPDFIFNDTLLAAVYSEQNPTVETFYLNRMQKWKSDAKNSFKSLRQPVDHKSWYAGPAVVNAYYSSNNNAITFPAGILQPPFYSEHYPKSLNYGAIGVVIGHEITHAFDDGGRRYDKDGNLHQWWTNQDVTNFKLKAQCIVDQYSNYSIPRLNLHLDGQLNQGENIADNGGIKESFGAYRKWVADRGEEELLLPGLEHDNNQLFFLGFAQVWCGKANDQALTRSIKTNFHSPAQFRVRGTVSNSPDFAKAFKCAKGSKMNPVTKCNVW